MTAIETDERDYFIVIQLTGTEAWTQWNQWGHWNASTSGSGNWEWSGVPPPGVTIDSDGKPVGLPAVPVIPPAPTISTTTDFNTPPPAPSLYSYNSVPPGQSYNQVKNERKWNLCNLERHRIVQNNKYFITSYFIN